MKSIKFLSYGLLVSIGISGSGLQAGLTEFLFGSKVPADPMWVKAGDALVNRAQKTKDKLYDWAGDHPTEATIAALVLGGLALTGLWHREKVVRRIKSTCNSAERKLKEVYNWWPAAWKTAGCTAVATTAYAAYKTKTVPRSLTPRLESTAAMLLAALAPFSLLKLIKGEKKETATTRLERFIGMLEDGIQNPAEGVKNENAILAIVQTWEKEHAGLVPLVCGGRLAGRAHEREITGFLPALKMYKEATDEADKEKVSSALKDAEDALDAIKKYAKVTFPEVTAVKAKA